MTLREGLEALLKRCDDMAHSLVHADGTKLFAAGIAGTLAPLLSTADSEHAKYPEGDRGCAHGCGECRWEAGPWHQRGCPSYRAADSEQREDWRGPWKCEDCGRVVGSRERTFHALRSMCAGTLVPHERRALALPADSLAKEVVWLLDNVRAIQCGDKSEEWWTRRNALLARMGRKT